MRAGEFINLCDLLGGLLQAFEQGYSHRDIKAVTADEKRVQAAVANAWCAYDQFKTKQSQYYTIVEEGNI